MVGPSNNFDEARASEVEAARHYVQRIAEDPYDDRPSGEVLMKAAGHIR